MTNRNRQFNVPPDELAMRVLRRVERDATKNPSWAMADTVRSICSEFGASKATAWRYVRTAMDVMGIHYVNASCRPYRHK